jgi:hypothetical protein
MTCMELGAMIEDVCDCGARAAGLYLLHLTLYRILHFSFIPALTNKFVCCPYDVTVQLYLHHSKS